MKLHKWESRDSRENRERATAAHAELTRLPSQLEGWEPPADLVDFLKAHVEATSEGEER